MADWRHTHNITGPRHTTTDRSRALHGPTRRRPRHGTAATGTVGADGTRASDPRRTLLPITFPQELYKSTPNSCPTTGNPVSTREDACARRPMGMAWPAQVPAVPVARQTRQAGAPTHRIDGTCAASSPVPEPRHICL